VTSITGSPFLSQLVGASIFAPMLLGGIAAGVLSDRLDRHRLIFAVQAVLIPVSLVMFVLVQTGAVRVWMVFPFMLALGMGGLINMTSQRTLLYDTVGPALAPRALTLDNVGMAVASIASTLLGGGLIQAIGIGSAFGMLSGAMCLSLVLVYRVPRPDRPASSVAKVSLVSLMSPGSLASLRDQVGLSLGLMRRSPSLRSMLGVTVVMNLFYFSFIPLVPVMAKHLGAHAFLTGVLASAAGVGQLIGGLVLAARGVRHRGRAFVVGSVLALGGLGAFAAAPVLALAFLALVLAGAGQAGFGSMQSLLAIESAGRAEQGAALGLLSTAVGALPLGMLYVGVSAQVLGAPVALLASSAGGIAVLAVCLQRWPHVLGPPDPGSR
jgi:MFS family permease